MVRASGQNFIPGRDYRSSMKRALITGAGHWGQVAETVASRLAADGYEVILVGRDTHAVQERASELTTAGRVSHAYAADLSDELSVVNLFARIRTAHGDALHAVIHLAGGF